MATVISTILNGWKWLWRTKINLPPLPVGLFAICLILVALGGPWLVDRVRSALTPDPPPATVETVTRIRAFDLPNLLEQPVNVPVTIETFQPKDPVQTIDTCISSPVGMDFALIPTRLGWPVFEVSDDQLKLALWQDNQWRRYTYRIASSKRVRPFAGMQVSTLGYGPYIGLEAVKGRLSLSVDVARNFATFGPDIGGSPWQVRAGLRVML